MNQSGGGSLLPSLAIQAVLAVVRWVFWIPRHFAVLYLADPTQVGSGYHLWSSAIALAVTLFVFYPWLGLGSGWNQSVWYLLLSTGSYAAWQMHCQRDKQRPSVECGSLRPEILGLLECLPLPGSCLTPGWQWRVWTPLLLILGSYPVDWWVCPALSQLMFLTGLFCFAIPGAWRAWSENSLRSRMEAMVHQGEAATGKSATYQPAHGQRGQWMQHTWKATGGWFSQQPHDAAGEVVACPTCHTTLDSTGLTDGELVECPCGQQFQISRLT
ncbi:MAG: hypothetical protein KDA69_19410 [Planctomycetaceae bacterium]|nr:hypothetical protein [Planctomycetaceae bacterium]MCA9046504.1 hypothetical protein [Planctomycetaceae bacterium]